MCAPVIPMFSEIKDTHTSAPLQKKSKIKVLFFLTLFAINPMNIVDLKAQERDFREHRFERKPRNWEELENRVLKEAQNRFASGKSLKEVSAHLKKFSEHFIDRHRQEIFKKFSDNPKKRQQEIRTFNQKVLRHNQKLEKILQDEWASRQRKIQKDSFVDRELSAGLKAAFKKFQRRKTHDDFEHLSQKMYQRLNSQGLSEADIHKKISSRRKVFLDRQKKRSDKNNKRRRNVDRWLSKGKTTDQIRKTINQENLDSDSIKKPDLRAELREKGYTKEEINLLLDHLKDQ